MKTILCYAPNHLDGISFYRMQGPLNQLEKEGKVKVINWGNTLDDFKDWTYFTRADILFISRPFRNADWKIVEVAKKYGLKIWSDFDDDLVHLPNDNDVFEQFSTKQASDAIRFVLSNSDIVTFATDYLESLYKLEFGLKNTLVIPNAIPPAFQKFKKPFNFNRKVCWRGTVSHIPELLFHESDIISMMNLHPEIEWRFLGVNPYFIYRKVKNANLKFSKGVPQIDFIHALTEFNASIHFCVLLDSHFHRSKSNLAWMDATLAGSAFLGPNFEEFKKPGVFTYRIMESQSFKNLLDSMIQASDATLKKSHDLSWEWIQDNILLERVNKLRVNLIENL